jgi:hypothetical protein
MDVERFKDLIRRELPVIMQDDMQIRDFVINITRTRFADKDESESRFNRMMEELRLNREKESRESAKQAKKWEENDRKWHEQHRESARKWDEQVKKWEENDRRWHEQNKRLAQEAEERKQNWAEQVKKWEENDRKWHEQHEESARKWDEQVKKWKENDRKWHEQHRESARKWDEQVKKWEENDKKWYAHEEKMRMELRSAIGALGARWGIQTEASFRDGLKAILEDSFDVEVLNVTEYDDGGEVFGRPDQVEIDVLIKDGTLILCELKSSMSRGDVYIFDRKVAFYEKHHNRTADRKLIISPMVDERGRRIAKKLNIEVYGYPSDIKEV